MDVRSEMIYAMVSAAVSGPDGIVYKTVAPQAVPLFTMAEMLRRLNNRILSPSATIASGGSAGSVQITIPGGSPSGILGTVQGWPFSISGTGTPSGAPTSLISTASTTIRKVLVTLGFSAFTSTMSSLALGGATVQFTYGSAVITSAGAVTSGGQTASYFDAVPLPQASAHEVIIGWLNVPNSFATSAGINASHMFHNFQLTQGANLSNLLAGVPQP